MSDLSAKVGQEISVDLPENASTGYRWFFEPSLGLEILRESSENLPPPRIIGGGYDRRIVVSSRTEGEFKLKATKKRTFSGEAAEIRDFIFTFTV